MKKVVFITGASRGIGLATAKKFLAAGWSVAGFFHQTAGQELEGLRWYQLEICLGDKVEAAFNAAYTDFGRVDAFVNCAGVFGYKSLGEYDNELFGKVIATNEMGTYHTTKAVMNWLPEGGSIVLISSTAAQVGSGDPIYAATKGAVLSFAKSMAKALAPKIRVNCVAPGVTDSDMTKNMKPERLAQLIDATPLKKMAQPEDVADAIFFLTSDEAKHITGACLDVNGGYVLR